MQVSPKPKKASRSKIGGIATAIALALVIGSFAVGPACADDHHGNGNRGDAQHHGDSDRGGHRPSAHYARQPYDYYAPPPNYYYAPEPDQYYAPTPVYSAPPQGISLFLGF